MNSMALQVYSHTYLNDELYGSARPRPYSSTVPRLYNHTYVDNEVYNSTIKHVYTANILKESDVYVAILKETKIYLLTYTVLKESKIYSICCTYRKQNSRLY